MHSKAQGYILVALLAVAALWTSLRHGFDWLTAVLFLAGLVLLFFPRRDGRGSGATNDVRLDHLRLLVGEVAAGKITGRMVNIGSKDAVGELCWGINNMLDQLEPCFREQQAVLRMAGEGKYFRKAQPVGLHGVFRDALQGSNQSLSVLEGRPVRKPPSGRRPVWPRRRSAC